MNIWIAAGDGKLDRVRQLVENGISPNAPDENTYTPMHAAASYGHLHVLDYLISHGGDVNITDSDGDTPLYTVENVETARYLIEHGAEFDRTNDEGIPPAVHLAEDFPEVSTYLLSLYTTTPPPTIPSLNAPLEPSQHSQDIVSEALTSALMESVQDIMARAEAEGRDPEEELRQMVQRAVLEGVIQGYEMTDNERRDEAGGDEKRRKV